MRAEKGVKQPDKHNPFPMANEGDHFTIIQAQNDERKQMMEEMKALKELVNILSAKAEAQSDRGSSLMRTRRTQEERTVEW